MANYTVKSGQNIYDVSMTIYGSVEGVFDLLVCNQWLNLETTLKPGMVLEYSDGLVVNKDVISWTKRSGTIYRNGEHPIDLRSALEVLQEHLSRYHKARWEQITAEPQNVQDEYWEWLSAPKMMIVHRDASVEMRVSFLRGTHMVVDWGDSSPMEILEGTEVVEADHSYKSATPHQITLYGDFRCETLDISEIHGPYYPAAPIVANNFRAYNHDPKLRTLIIKEEDLE